MKYKKDVKYIAEIAKNNNIPELRKNCLNLDLNSEVELNCRLLRAEISIKTHLIFSGFFFFGIPLGGQISSTLKLK